MKTISASTLLSKKIVSLAPKQGTDDGTLVALLSTPGFLEGAYTLIVAVPMFSPFGKRYRIAQQHRFIDAEDMLIAAQEFYHLTGQEMPEQEQQRLSECLPLL